MINRVPIEELAKEIRTTKRSGPSDVDAAIEKYLEQRLQGVSPT